MTNNDFSSLRLKKLNLADGEKEYGFFQRMPEENGFLNPYRGMNKEKFLSETLPQRLDYAQGIGLAPGYVPDTYCFLWLDDEIIGNYKLRHRLNDFLRSGSGHIGFGILPEYRGCGFGTKGLTMAIRELIALPDFQDEEIYMSCLKTNPASLRVMQKNGGTIHHESENEYFVRIPLHQ
jgi:predicted acetyltransferase